MKAKKEPSFAPNGKLSGQANAFTLIELLVVIIIIAILAALLLPVLGNAKKKGQQTSCVNNEKQFTLALSMYADDYKDHFLAYAMNTSGTSAGGFYQPPLNAPFTGQSVQQAYSECIQALKSSLLTVYVKNVAIYHCPGDMRTSRPPGNGYAYQSYSKTQNYAGDSYDSYWGMGNDCEKAGDVLAPAMTFAIVEDTDTRGFNEGTWVVTWTLNGANPGSFTWVDPLAVYHVNVNIWGFVDGHVESHKWTDPAAITAGLVAATGVYNTSSFYFNAATSGGDYNYIRNRLRFPGWQ